MQAAERLIKKFAELEESGGKIKINAGMLRQMAAAGVSAATLAATLGVSTDKLATLDISAGKVGEAFQQALISNGAKSLELMGLKWSSIVDMMRTAWGDIFEDMGNIVSPLMTEVRALFAEFAAGSPIQAGAKSLMTSFLTGVFHMATVAVHAIHILFLGIEIGAMKAYLFALPLINLFKAIYSNAMVLRGIVTILAMIAAPFVAVAVVIGIVIAAFVAVGTVVGMVVSLIVAAVSWMAGRASKALTDFAGLLGGLNLGGVGMSIVDSLVGGIMSGVVKVAGAMAAITTAIKSALPSALQMHSPSVVLTRQAEQAADSVIEPLEEGEGRASAAMAKLGGGRPKFQGKSSGGKSSGGGNGGPLIGVLNISGGNAKEIWEELEPKLLELLLRRIGAAQDDEPEGETA